MVNTRRKGNRIERKAEERLNNHGFNTSRMPHTRFGDNDFFNLYDIIAAKPGANLKAIQVKANNPPNLSKLAENTAQTLPKTVEVEAWTWHDYQGWKNRKLNRKNQKWEVVLDQTS